MRRRGALEENKKMALLTAFGLFGVLISFLGAEAQSCARNWMEIRGDCYAYFDEKVSWAEAEIECLSYGRGAHLASILTKAEADLLVRYIANYQKDPSHVWIGLHDVRQNGNWRWSDGSPYNYKAWMRNKPNNTNNQEDCVELHSSTQFKEWNNDLCEKRNAYICKLPLITGISERRCLSNLTEEVKPLPEDQLGNWNGTSIQSNLGGLDVPFLPNICPRNWLTYQGNCYGFFHQKLSWYEAEIECQSYGLGTHLASILARSEMLIISNHISAYKREAGVDVWIGLHDYHQNGKWRWTDESVFNYKNWIQREPNKLWNSKHCVALKASTEYTKWSNVACSKAKAYICKHQL